MTPCWEPTDTGYRIENRRHIDTIQTIFSQPRQDEPRHYTGGTLSTLDNDDKTPQQNHLQSVIPDAFMEPRSSYKNDPFPDQLINLGSLDIL